MPTIISANLKRLCKLKELTISQLAEKSGVSVRTIERIRTGKHVPDIDIIKKLAKALGQKPEHLVEGAIDKLTKAETKEILKRAKDPKSKYMTLEDAQTKLSEPERKRLAKDMHRTLEELERKDFTKFERELGKKKPIVIRKTIVFTAEERNQAEAKERELQNTIDGLQRVRAEENDRWEARVIKAKRQIILAVILAWLVVIFFYLLFQLLPNT